MWKLDILGTRYIQSMCMGHIAKTINQTKHTNNSKDTFTNKNNTLIC